MNKLSRAIVPLALVGTLAVSGCAGGSNRKNGSRALYGAMPTMTMSSNHQAEMPQSAAAANTTTVAIANFAFSPAMVTVKTGTTLTWTNHDQDPHTVTASSGAFRSATLTTGATFRHTFTTPGRFSYLCTIHPFMTATVVVTP